MKRNKFQLYVVLLLVVSLFACESALEKKNLEKLVADDLWADPVLLKGFMDNVMRDNLPGVNTMTSRTDEGYGQYDISEIYDNISINTGFEWNYESIRRINMFLDNADKCPEERLSVASRNDYIAQMKTLRAWRYFEMVRRYGGVPLLLHAQDADEDLYVKREKTSVCIQQIIRDLDDAIAMGADFPMTRIDAEGGRITRAAALAFKGRILLFYASPQFSSQTPAGTKDATTRWNEAYTANKTAVEQLTAAGYGLFRPNPATPEEAIQNRNYMFSEQCEIGPNNPEMIWVRRYQYPQRTSFTGAIRDDITLEMANAYANADGSPYTGIVIPPAGTPGFNLATANVPYWQGREPRFYTDVLWNGKNHPMFRLSALDNDKDASGKQIHWWKFMGGANAPYYQCERLDQLGQQHCKMADTKINETISNGNQSGVDWPLIRYAEVLLNLAECAAKTGKESEAMDILKQIRKRAGIPEGNNNYGIGNPAGDALILAILNERRIELAYEGFRYWDVRRWRLYTDAIAGYKYNGIYRHTMKARPLAGVSIGADILATIDENDPASYFAVFDNEIHAMDATPIQHGERQYFFHISVEGHIKRNPNLEQTNGWEGGTFNPYE